MSCFRNHGRRKQCLKKLEPRVLLDKSTFPLEKHALGMNSTTVGPDELNVASTAWPNASLEKRGLGIWDGETEKADVEAFLYSELPSHPYLYQGQLKNGLRYLILPNKVPANGYEFRIFPMLLINKGKFTCSCM